MRKSRSMLGSLRASFPSRRVRIALVCALAVLFFQPVATVARTTTASSRTARNFPVQARARKRRTSGHAGSTRFSAARARKLPATRRSSIARQHAVLNGRGSRGRHSYPPRTVAALRKARRRRARLTATLDNVRTHTLPVAARASSFAEGTTAPPQELSGGGDSTSHVAMVDAGAPGPTGQPLNADGGAGVKALPNFNLAVPSYMPMPLRGSHEVLIHQNIIADVEGLNRIQNDFQLRAMVRSGDLVALPAGSRLAVDARLPLNRRYCRPWTAQFLSDLSRAHARVFDRPLQLTSAVRTVNFQRHLARYNGNAAPFSGQTASPHLTGQAIDLGKKGMSQHEIAWMRAILGQLQNSGKLDVEEEFEQACFHISVYKTYLPESRRPIADRLIARNDGAPEIRRPESAIATTPATAVNNIGSLARPVAAPRMQVANVHAYPRSRRVTVRRRRRHHHANISLLAARMR